MWVALAASLPGRAATPVNREGGEVQVFAAASLSDALGEIVASYQAATGEVIRLNLGASSTLALQIVEGAPADIFFSADEATMDRVERAGLLVPGSRRKALSNTLVVVVPADSSWSPAGPEELVGSKLKVLALAEPETVPAGRYAKAYLESIGRWDDVGARVVPTENVRAALAAVEAGNADAAIVYKTDAAISKKVRVAYEVPRETGPPISYAVALVRRDPPEVPGTSARGARFIEFLGRPEVEAVFVRYGFLLTR